MAVLVTGLLGSLPTSIFSRGDMQQEQSKADYEAPEILDLGDAADLTTGSTRNFTDFLGDTSTQYQGHGTEPPQP